MTGMATYSGAFSGEKENWSTIRWNRAYRNVRRLQARIVKATQAKRWGKVKALAIRRVTENKGKIA
jgi:RNA-directed DNA polymerase